MNLFVKWILQQFSDEDLKEELRSRGYATDIKIQFMSSLDDMPHEYLAIGKDVISNG